MTLVLRWLARAFMLLVVLNEVRGTVLAAPVLWAMYQAGGTAMALWLAFCSLAGIALSVLVPVWAVRRASRLLAPAGAQ